MSSGSNKKQKITSSASKFSLTNKFIFFIFFQKNQFLLYFLRYIFIKYEIINLLVVLQETMHFFFMITRG